MVVHYLRYLLNNNGSHGRDARIDHWRRYCYGRCYSSRCLLLILLRDLWTYPRPKLEEGSVCAVCCLHMLTKEKIDVKYTIFERDANLNVRSNEWTMAIHWSLDRLEAILPPSIYADMERASCNPAVPIEAGGDYPIIHGETGRMLAGVPYKKGLRVPRSKMRALCAGGIEVQVCILTPHPRLSPTHTGYAVWQNAHRHGLQ